MKKIIILTSEGGGGHLSASKALTSYLDKNNEYSVNTICVFKDILISLDLFKIITGNYYSGEELYNFLLQKGYYRTIHFLFYTIGIWYIHIQQNHINKLLYNYFTTQKPALIISVTPCINNTVLSAAQKLNIPFILLPTDLDMRMYLNKIYNPLYKDFYLCAPFTDTCIMNYINNAHIPHTQVIVTGAVLKKDFFIPKNTLQLRLHHTINNNKPIIMVIMGSQGSYKTEQYTQELIKMKCPANLLICVGKNEHSKKILSHLTIPHHINLHIIDFTEHIAEYMALADLLITKPGSISLCEAIYMNIPVLLDATSTAIEWEKFNYDFVKRHAIGDIITNYHMTSPLVEKLISNKSLLAIYRQNMLAIKKQNIEIEIKQLVNALIDKNATQ